MDSLIFTFKESQVHEDIKMKNYYVKVTSENAEIGKAIVKIIYGDFSRWYYEKHYNTRYKQLLDTIKQRKTDG